MSWGQTQAVAPPAPFPTIVICEAPECKSVATLAIKTPHGEDAKACCEHADGCTIVGVVEGAPFDERTRDALLLLWKHSKEVLERAKTSEMDVRKMVAAYVFADPKEGVNNHELGGGYVLKMGHKLNYKFKASNDEIDATEDKCAALGNEGQFLAERIIVWKADFSKSEYNKLDTSLPTHKAVKDLIDGILEVTPGSPTLEIKEPKATLNG